MYELGAITLPDTITIAPNKQYTFTFSSWMSKDSITRKMSNLAAYAKNITIETSGMTKVIINLVPMYAMPLSAWRDQFAGIGLSDMTDVYIGSYMTEPGFEFVNPVTYWEPKIKSAGSWLGDTLSGAFGYVKILAIAGAVIAGSAVVLKYGPSKQKYKENPKRKKR